MAAGDGNSQQCPRHTIAPGDTLSGIAARYLGSPAKFPAIAQLNPKIARNPKALKLGDVVVIPCRGLGAEAPTPKSAKSPPDPAKRSNGGWLSRLFGGDRSQATKPEPSVASPPKPPDPIPVPVWKASKGEFLIDVLKRWGEEADHQIVIEDRGDWRFEVGFSFEGTFNLALEEVVKGFGTGPHSPLLVAHANNVIRIGSAR